MESQDKGDATKGEEVATSRPSRAEERAQPEDRRKQLESSQKMDWREYSYFRNSYGSVRKEMGSWGRQGLMETQREEKGQCCWMHSLVFLILNLGFFGSLPLEQGWLYFQTPAGIAIALRRVQSSILG